VTEIDTRPWTRRRQRFTVGGVKLPNVLPKEEVAKRSSEPGSQPYIRSYVFMRRVVGWLAVVLPPLLVFGEPLVFDDRPFPLGSLSAYYYSGFREIFVGFLCAIGVFLVIYKWPERTRESWVSSFAGLAVVVVAFFPTGKPGNLVATTPLQDLIGEVWVERIHYAAAFVFIFLLSRISHYWAKHRPERRRLHKACERVILAALVLAALEGLTNWPDYGILIAEFAAVWAFGISWLATVERLSRPAPP
jgi:hypothetical protein